jgi:hypothetical protein
VRRESGLGRRRKIKELWELRIKEPVIREPRTRKIFIKIGPQSQE